VLKGAGERSYGGTVVALGLPLIALACIVAAALTFGRGRTHRLFFAGGMLLLAIAMGLQKERSKLQNVLIALYGSFAALTLLFG
jgi:hypothetical protein